MGILDRLRELKKMDIQCTSCLYKFKIRAYKIKEGTRCPSCQRVTGWAISKKWMLSDLKELN